MDALGAAWATSTWSEITREQPLNVTQPLPSWLRGQYFLCSSAAYEMGGRNLTHAFDGFSKYVRWRLDGINTEKNMEIME